MIALWNKAGHYIFALCISIFFFFYLFSFSSPNLSRRRLDVYHTSTHGVALVRIRNACLKYDARRSLKVQDAKNRHFGTISQLYRAVSSKLRHVYRQWEKNLLNVHTSSTCTHYMVNFGLLTAEICWLVWGTPTNIKRVSRLGSVTARHSSSGRQPNSAALNRGRHLYSAGRPSRWALAHVLVLLIFFEEIQLPSFTLLRYFLVPVKYF